MTDPNHDGWPEEYRDPRDRPHPEVLCVTVESFDGMCEETLAAAEGVDEGGHRRPWSRSRRSPGCARSSPTAGSSCSGRSWIEGAAESITALADSLDRDYRAVHDDVTLLADYGLVFVIEEGQSKRPYLPYERIHLDVELVGGEPGEDSTPA